MINRNKCLRCEHEWTPRIDKPVVCPHCKSYLWFKAKDIPQEAKIEKIEQAQTLVEITKQQEVNLIK